MLVIVANAVDDNWPLNSPASTAPVTEMPAAFTLPPDTILPSVEIPFVADNNPTVARPFTVNTLNSPMLVIVANAVDDNCPLNSPASTAPVTEMPAAFTLPPDTILPCVEIPFVADNNPTVARPFTVNTFNSPMLVIVANAVDDNCPLNSPASTAPVTAIPAAFTLPPDTILPGVEIPFVADSNPTVARPFTVNTLNSPMLVIVANAVDDNCPLNKPASTAPVTEMPAAFTLPLTKLPTCAWPLTLKLFNWPMLVIVFCAVADKVPLNVPPSITPLTDKLFKFPTLVILANAVDDNGPLKSPASTAPVTEMPAAFTLPDEARLPTCAAPVTVKPPDCNKLVEIPFVADSNPTVARPFTVNTLNSPMLVIVANAVDDNCPLNKPASTAPVTEMPAAFTLPPDTILPGVEIPFVADNNPTVARPFTVNTLNSPMLVIVANAVDDNCPLNSPASTAPVTEMPAADILPLTKLPTCAWPLTLKLFNWPILVIVFCAVADKVPLNVPPSIIPLTDKLFKFPTLVILANAVDDNGPLNSPASTAPVTEIPAAFTLPDEARLPTCAAPVTVKPPDCNKLVEIPLVADNNPTVARPLTVNTLNCPMLVIVANAVDDN